MNLQSLLDPAVTADGAATASRRLRGVLGTFATGVTIVTTAGAGHQRIGLTVNSFSSVSLDPPLVLWSLARKSVNLQHFLDASAFAIHILSADQEDLALRFSAAIEDRFAGLSVNDGPHRVPVIDGCAAALVCEPSQTIDAGDHVLFIGTVISLGAAEEPADPLVFYRGKLRPLAQPQEA